MHRNLRAEMVRTGIKPKDIAEFLGVRYATVIDKLNGRYDFSYKEASSIKRHFFPDHDIEYLFETDENEIA